MSNMASREMTALKRPLVCYGFPGGPFFMGSVDFYPEEGPVHEVSVDSFLMDQHAVTNEQFARFV